MLFNRDALKIVQDCRTRDEAALLLTICGYHVTMDGFVYDPQNRVSIRLGHGGYVMDPWSSAKWLLLSEISDELAKGQANPS